MYPKDPFWLSSFMNFFFKTDTLDTACYTDDDGFSSERNEILSKLMIEVDQMFKLFENNYL